MTLRLHSLPSSNEVEQRSIDFTGKKQLKIGNKNGKVFLGSIFSKQNYGSIKMRIAWELLTENLPTFLCEVIALLFTDILFKKGFKHT